MTDTTGVVLLSGGLDSSTVLAMATERLGLGNLYAISFDYGQKHRKELDAARRIAEKYVVREHRVVRLPSNVFEGGGSALMNEMDMPQASYEELHNSFGVSPTYVPFRNANLLSMATAYALTVGAGFVFAGMHAEDAHNWAYPDCTPEFLGAMTNAIYVGTYHKVRLVAPLMDMTKAQVVKTGLELGVPFELTWSCYEGGDEACGKCPTCIGRLEAFKLNGVADPAPYLFRPAEYRVEA